MRDKKTKSKKKKVEKVKVDYPENKTLKKLKRKANRQYKTMTQALKDAEEAHVRFHKTSKEYAKTLLEIESEAIMPNFGER